MELILIAAVARNGIIGTQQQLPWHLPEDMRHFRTLTQGHPVVMGRKTWESLPPAFRPLPGRYNLVLTRQIPTDPTAFAGAQTAASLPIALEHLSAESQVFVIGGAEIYQQAIPFATRLEITEVDMAPAGDAKFPDIDPRHWVLDKRQAGCSANGLHFAFCSYRRIS